MGIRSYWQGLTPKDRGGFVLVTAITLAFYIFVVIGAGGGFWLTGHLLERDGVPSVATVTNTSDRSTIRYRWQVGQDIFESSDGEGKRIHGEGQTIPIRYLPYRPSVAHFDWRRLEWRGKMIVLMGIPFGALPYLMAAHERRLKSKRRGLKPDVDPQPRER